MEDNNEVEKIFWRISSKEPIPICLHSNLGLAVSKALAKKINKYGGNPKATEDEAEVIICRKEGPMFPFLTKKYDHERYKWVEPPLWVDTCISKKKYEHPIRKPLLRSYPSGRSQFTPAEDERIVRFLAKRIPWREMKGRSGQNVWKDLCNRTDLYPWAVKHTWQSWRERYVKNSAIFDKRIEAVVRADPDPPPKGGKGQYRVEYGGPGPRSKPQPNGISCSVEEEEEEGEYIDIEAGIAKRTATSVSPTIEMPSPKRRRIETGLAEQRREEEEEEEEEEEIEEVETQRPGPSNDVSGHVAQVDTPITPTLAPSVPQKSMSPELPFIASVSSASQHSLPGTTSFIRKGNRLTVVPVTSALGTESRPIIPNQTTTLDNNDPPALRTRSRSRQASLEPPVQPIEQSRTTRRARATASSPPAPPPPPPPPPPTLATQTLPLQTIDFDQLRAQQRRKVAIKPTLIPISETSESSMVNLGRRRTETSISNTPQVKHMVQIESKPTVMSDDSDNDDDDDDDDDVQFDGDLDLLDSDSSDDTSAMRLFNEGMEAITNKTVETDTNEQDQTLKAKSGTFMRARKTPYTGPPLHRKPISDESEEEDEEDENQSENEESDNGTQSSDLMSLNTETSVPAVGTNARKYLISRTPFTPARGTLAEKRFENRKWNLRDSKVDKGKERAW